jgi:hypothetical protein
MTQFKVSRQEKAAFLLPVHPRSGNERLPVRLLGLLEINY